ncbi:MAG: insulinase family protein [Rhodocyclaceae bacterium]|nr:insulinase family protein [Rhodocyclaceae bacterium]
MRFLIALCAFLFAPLAGAALPVQHWQTAAGARVYLVENHDLPMLDVSIQFPAGSAWEGQRPAGTAALTSRLFSAGTAGLSEQQVSDRLADTGSQLAPSVDDDLAGFSLRTLSSAAELDSSIGLLATLLAAPQFPEAVLEREKARTISGLKEAETKPETQADRAFSKAVFGDHPYGRDADPASVARITRDDLTAFYAERYRVGGAVLVMVGDIDRAGAEALAERLTAGLPAGAPQPDALPPVKPLAAGAETRVPHHATQAHIVVGQTGMKRGDPDYFPLYVGNYVLGGGGFVSRLTDEVRQKRGLAYSVYSYFMPRLVDGPFQVGLQTKRESASEALAVVRDTLARFMAEGPSEDELQAAKSNLIDGFPLRIENNRKILDYLAMVAFYKLPPSYIDDFTREIDAVTVAQIRDAFKRRIDPAKMVTVVVAGGEDTPDAQAPR